jgi:N-acetylmuramoyl-L-alanine amidase
MSIFIGIGDRPGAIPAEYHLVQQSRNLEKNTVSKKAENRITVSDEEKDLLLRVVMAEAGGSTYELQRAVASAIVNRVISDVYPDTMMKVLKQKSQFSVMFDGALDRYPPSKSVTEAVEEALREDFIEGATSFLDEDLSSSSNVKNMYKYNSFVIRIENIDFLIHNSEK